jgi:hypothetical protein
MKIGTRLQDTRGRSAVVTAVYGSPDPASVRILLGGAVLTGGRCTVDFIDDEGNEHRQVPEAIVTSLPWKIAPGEATPEELSDYQAGAVLKKAADSSAAEENARLFRERRAQLLVEYPNLATEDKGGKLTLAAKNLRVLLKATFPGVKFSVTTSRFSGGNSMDVKWTDGPGSRQVAALADRFSGGDFDGMTDSYNYRRSPWTDLFGEAKYVHSRRDNSEAALLAAARSTFPDRDPAEVAKAYEWGRLDYHDSRAMQAALNPTDEKECA